MAVEARIHIVTARFLAIAVHSLSLCRHENAYLVDLFEIQVALNMIGCSMVMPIMMAPSRLRFLSVLKKDRSCHPEDVRAVESEVGKGDYGDCLTNSLGWLEYPNRVC